MVFLHPHLGTSYSPSNGEEATVGIQLARWMVLSDCRYSVIDRRDQGSELLT